MMFVLILCLLLLISVMVMAIIAIASWRNPPLWRKCPVCLRYHRNGQMRYLTPFVASPEMEICHKCNSKPSNLPTL